MSFAFSLHQTDWGCLAAVWSEAGLWELTFPLPSAQTAQAKLMTKVNNQAGGSCVERLDAELKAYFSGTLFAFSTPVDWSGYTLFQAAVLQYMADIPCGEVRTYGAAAAAAGSPRAARAAGGALHSNRTPIVVPCHRVIGATGGLVGFGGGLDMKARLLELEKKVLSGV